MVHDKNASILVILFMVGLKSELGKAEATRIKNILFGTTFFEHEDWRIGGWMPVFKQLCPVQNCQFTHNRQHLPQLTDFDAVLFHSANLPWWADTLPRERTRDQVYIFFSLESPLMDGQDLRSYTGYFNWTMTYRKDSDVVIPYGWMVPKEPPIPAAPSPPRWRSPASLSAPEEAVNRTGRRLVSWVVSKCSTPSKRADYADRLQKCIPVDEFGWCSGKTCNQECYDNIWREYKFYLSFENSYCKEYITEKFWTALQNGVVPVVLGAGDYSTVAPPYSFINVQDFRSVEELAAYLLMLDGNETEYNKYFWWREHYTVVDQINLVWAQSMCNLCMKLEAPEEQVYADIGEWWQYQQCTVHTDGADWFHAHSQLAFMLLNVDTPTLTYSLTILACIFIICKCKTLFCAVKNIFNNLSKNIKKSL